MSRRGGCICADRLLDGGVHTLYVCAPSHEQARPQPLFSACSDTLASTAAGTGIQLVTIWQDLVQITARYGERAATVVNNYRAKLVLSGVSDEPTLRYVAALAGETAVPHRSRTTDPEGRRSHTEATQWRQLASADALRRLSPGEALLLYAHLPPARLTLRPWYKERALRGRVPMVQTRHWPRRARSSRGGGTSLAG